MGVGDGMNNEVKKQLTLSLILLALLIATLFFWYPNFMFHTYVERLDYQYCLRGENDEFVVDGYQFYQDGQTQGYGHARITPLKSQVFKKNDEVTLTLILSQEHQLSQKIKIQNDDQVVTLDEQESEDVFLEEDIQNAKLQISVNRQNKTTYDQTIELKNQDMFTYTSANKDYTLTNVYVTENWLKTGVFSSKDQDLAKEYPYMIINYMYSHEQNHEVNINDYERFVYLKGKTEDFLNDQVEGIGYYDGQGSLFDMQLCCVITLMKSEDDLHPYTFTLPLSPIQKGE